MTNGKIIESDFKQAWWLPEQHSQTLFSTVFKRKSPIHLTTDEVDLPDGDFVEIAWTEPRHQGPVIVLFHGMEGSVKSSYAQGILHTIEQLGWQGVLMHFRGCGSRDNRLPRWYHSGDSPDIDFFIRYLQEHYPNRPLGAIGVSLGGNALLKYLGEQGDASPLTAAMAISVPFDLANTSQHLTRGFSRIYQRHLIKLVQKKVIQKYKKMPLAIDIEAFKQAKTFYQVDNAAAKMHGFASADDYYKRASARQFLKTITVPTWILHSKNDPFMTRDAIPQEHELASKVTMELTNKGGHVGFIYGNNPLKANYWIDHRVKTFFESQFIE